MALAAPLLADPAGLHAVNTIANPAWANPSEFARWAPTTSGAA